jgi:hypothetical protein
VKKVMAKVSSLFFFMSSLFFCACYHWLSLVLFSKGK